MGVGTGRRNVFNVETGKKGILSNGGVGEAVLTNGELKKVQHWSNWKMACVRGNLEKER